MAVEALYALQNGFMGAERSLLFYGEYSAARVQIPIACWLVKTSDGVVLFDDLRQGLSASYNPGRFYTDPRLFKTIFIVLGLWLVWVLGGTRLRAPAIAHRDPSEADLVKSAGVLIARTVAPWQQAQRLFDQFFAAVSRAARGASGMTSTDRGDLWSWLERHAAILPQEMDQLKTWYADAHARGKPPLVPLQNLLDNLERRITT